MRKKKIKIPLYFGELILIEDRGLMEVKKKHNFKEMEGFAAISFRNPTKKGYSRYVIAVRKGWVKPDLIAHEAMHIVSKVFEDRGMQCQLDNDEPQAYLMGWVVKECHKFFKVKKS